MKVTIKATDKVEHNETFEFAAWWRTWKLLPGEYTLKAVKLPYDYSGKMSYVAEVDAEVTEDYLASHFGGVPFGGYDTKQNAGKKGTRHISFSAIDVLKHNAISLTEVEYDAMLIEAMSLLEYKIDIALSCINSSVKENRFDSIAGHTASLNQYADQYADFSAIKRRREYNAKQEAGSQWLNKDIYADRTNKF